MKQSSSAARPGPREPAASRDPVGRAAACELHLAAPQTAAGGQRPALAAEWDGAPLAEAGHPKWAHTVERLKFGAFPVALGNLPPP